MPTLPTKFKDEKEYTLLLFDMLPQYIVGNATATRRTVTLSSFCSDWMVSVLCVEIDRKVLFNFLTS